MRTLRSIRLRRAALALPVGAVLALGACEENRADVFSPIGPRALDFSMSPDGTGLPGGTVTAGGGVATVAAVGLPQLGGGVYQFWGVALDSNGNDVYTKAFGSVLELFLRDSVAGGMVVLDPVTGEPIKVTDTTVVSAAGAATYVGTNAGADSVFQVNIVLDSLDGTTANPDGQNTILLTIESAEAASPGTTRFLWRRIGPGGGGALTFGNFAGADPISASNPADYVFTPAGSGRGGFRGMVELSVDFRGLPRPPVGFFYRGVLVDTAGSNVLVDTLRSGWSAVPEFSRVNLYNADVNPTLPDVVGSGINNAQLRNCPQGANVNNCQNSIALTGAMPFAGFVTVELRLVPKAVAALGGGSAMLGDVPELVRAPR